MGQMVIVLAPISLQRQGKVPIFITACDQMPLSCI
jgi:hypothetical protein